MRILKRETTTTGEDGSWQVVARSAEDHAPWARARIAAIAGTAQVELPEGSETLLFALASPTQTAFVIGAKGRNAGLVQRYAGLRVVIRADCDVLVTPARTKVDPLLARRIVLATSLGGVLRWFVTPKATIEGYPAASADALRAAAKEFACDLVTMRSHRGMCVRVFAFAFCVFNPRSAGHVCLLLLPILEVPHDADRAAIDAEIQKFRDGPVAAAREKILAMLPAVGASR